MTRDSTRPPEPWTPVRKVFYWIVIPLVVLLQAASIFAGRRPPADASQRTQFISACYKALDPKLMRNMTRPVRPEELQPTNEGYRWQGDVIYDEAAYSGAFVPVLVICEGPPEAPNIRLEGKASPPSDHPAAGRAP